MKLINEAGVLHWEVFYPSGFWGAVVDQLLFALCRHSEFKVSKVDLGREAESTSFQSYETVDRCFVCVAGLYVVD